MRGFNKAAFKAFQAHVPKILEAAKSFGTNRIVVSMEGGSLSIVSPFDSMLDAFPENVDIAEVKKNMEMAAEVSGPSAIIVLYISFTKDDGMYLGVLSLNVGEPITKSDSIDLGSFFDECPCPRCSEKRALKEGDLPEVNCSMRGDC